MSMRIFTGRRRALVAAAAIAAISAGVIPRAALAQAPFLGEIRFFAGNFAPRDWAFCDGQLLSIAEYTALYSVIGTLYGGDGRTTFALPDARGRSLVHAGAGPDLPDVVQGTSGGAAAVVLTQSQLPAHTHGATSTAKSSSTSTLHAVTAEGDQNAPAGHVLADDRNDNIYSALAPDTTMNGAAVTTDTITEVTTTIANAGGGQPVPTVSPYVAVACIIALRGNFPPRN